MAIRVSNSTGDLLQGKSEFAPLISPKETRRPSGGGGGSRSTSTLTYLPGERPAPLPLLPLSSGSRPGSRSNSQPSSRPGSGSGRSSGRSSPAMKQASMIRLTDEPNTPVSTPTRKGSAAERGSSAGQERKASLSRLPGGGEMVAEAPTITSPGANRNTSPVANRTTARQRMGLSLAIQTDNAPPKAQIPRETFRVLEDGETISNYYDCGESIYCGGARGKVLNAKRLSDGQDVVIKVRSKYMHRHGERGWREVMSQLHDMRAKNEHVLDILEILEDRESFFVVMPKCDGGELFNFLVTEAEVPESECKRIIREILYAVGHLHENNLIHRDVKPENILFDIDKHLIETPKTVKLIDFDTCMEWTPVTPKSRNFVGTPGYIAPEALMGQACPQSDLWSVGVICYILMTGETPWTQIETLEDGTVGSRSALRMYNSIKSAVVDWESEPWPDFPLARDLCQKLMAFDTEDRAFSVQEALDHPWLQVDTCN